MTIALKLDDAQSFHLGWYVAQEYTKTLGIELICAIYSETLQYLDDSVAHVNELNEIPDCAIEEDYRRGWAQGLRAACGYRIRQIDETSFKDGSDD